MKIEVTLADIETARHNRQHQPDFCPCVGCPIALAMAREVPRKKIHVNRGSVEFHGHMTTETAFLPAIAKDFIEAFDEREQVNPFAFELEAML